MLLRYAVVLICALLAVACKQEPPDQTEAATHSVVSPLVKDVTINSEYVADIRSVRYVEVRSKVKGYLEKILVDEGQTVEAGQLLFILNAEELKKELLKADAALKSAVANLRVAEVELEGVSKLYQKNIVSKTEYDVALARAEKVKADMAEAQAHKAQVETSLSFAHIAAPFSGTVNRFPNKVGSLIDEGDMLTSISNNNEVFAYFNVSEVDYLDNLAARGHEVKTVGLRLANHDLYPHAGKIETVESEFDPGTGNIAFRARFPNPEYLLKQGSNGKVIVKKTLPQAMLIPQKSTFDIQDKLFVFVVRNDGTVKQRNITAKARIPDYFILESGLAKDERILLEGVENVRDGDKVQAKPITLVAETQDTATDR